MSSPIQALVNTQLPAAEAALYTAPAGFSTQISKLLCVNTDIAAHTVTLYIVAANASAATSNISTSAQGLLPGQSWASPNEAGIVLGPGDSLHGKADSATIVNIFVSGVVTAS